MRTTALMLMFLAILVLLSSKAHADLLVNGDFEQGDVGFQTQYTRLNGTASNPASSNPGQYQVTINPIYVNPYWYAGFGDHTSGHGNMLLVDGSQNPSQYLWQETVSGLSVGTIYNFSGWAASVDAVTETPPATLMIASGGSQIGSLVNISAVPAVWQRFTVSFAATSSTMTFQIFDEQTSQLYNDFALDDLSLTVASVPEPASLLMLSTGVIAVLGYLHRRHAIDPSTGAA
ncbi:MAG: PEP-CTERM sorting domain-containing protein [Isosphaeraceae bacterium]